MKYIILFGVFLIAFTSIAQTSTNKKDSLYAKQQLVEALKNEGKNDGENTKYELLFKNKESAIKYAELVLFDVYGKEQIESEKPYKIFLINGYWSLYGSLPDNYKGGVFQIIFNAYNGKLIKLSHGK